MAAAIQQLVAPLQRQETAVTILTAEREGLTRQVQSLTGTPGQRVRTGVVDTRAIGKPDQPDGDPMKYADWYRRHRDSTQPSDSEGSALSTQMYHILVMKTAGAALDSFGRGVVPIQRRHSKQAGCVRENRTRQRDPIRKDRGRRHQDRSDDAGDGGHASERTPHPEQRQDHKLDSDARGDSRHHENTTVHRQSTIANAARSESEEQGQGQGQGRQEQRQGQGCKERIVQESKERRSEKVLLLQQVRPREGRLQKETERPCGSRGETGGRDATSKRHSSGRAVAGLTPMLLSEQRNVMRVFQ